MLAVAGKLVLVSACFMFASFGLYIWRAQQPSTTPRRDLSGANVTACRYVYVDCGVNNGVNIRKLFEPTFYTGSWFVEHFRDSFGNATDTSTLCAFGFEANRVHTARLQRVQEAYIKEGWRVHLFTETAIGYSDGEVAFHRDVDERPGDPFYKPDRPPQATSASTMHDHGYGSSQVRSVDIVRFLTNLRSGDVSPIIVLKMDVEGEEHYVLPKLLLSGVFCDLSKLFVEWHAWPMSERRWHMPNLRQVMEHMQRAHPDCKVRVYHRDDESYADDRNLSVADGFVYNRLPDEVADSTWSERARKREGS